VLLALDSEVLEVIAWVEGADDRLCLASKVADEVSVLKKITFNLTENYINKSEMTISHKPRELWHGILLDFEKHAEKLKAK
jgi:hypothetical protein